MKQLKLFALLGALLFSFIACNEEYEESYETTVKENKFKFTVLDKSDIQKNAFLTKKINEFSRFKNEAVLNRVVYDSIYDFFVDTDNAVLIEGDSIISYTFPVFRNGQEFVSENLIIQTQGGNTVTYLADYKQDINIINSMSSQEINNLVVDYYSLDFDYNALMNGKAAPINIICIDFYEYGIPPDQGEATGGSIEPQWYISSSICENVGGGSGGGYTGGGDNGYSGGDSGSYSSGSGSGIGTGNYGGSGGGNGGGNHNNNIVTTPVVELKLTPCEIIKDKTSTPEYKQKFKALNTLANYNLPDESGFGQVGDTYVDGTPHPTKHTILFPDGSKNGTHVHNCLPKTDPNTGNTFDGAVKMLSHGDIVQLIDFQVTNTDPTEAYVIMASNEGIFAITITQPLPIPYPIELAIFIGQGRKDFEKEEHDILTDCIDASNPVNCRKEKLQKHLLKTLKDVGLDNYIALFEGEVENENDPDINNYNIKWTRKTLKKGFLGQSLQDAPCN